MCCSNLSDRIVSTTPQFGASIMFPVMIIKNANPGAGLTLSGLIIVNSFVKIGYVVQNLNMWEHAQHGELWILYQAH
jgi:hypothetical protein